MRACLLAICLSVLANMASALTESDLRDDGYVRLDCRFNERCLLGQPCERAWRDFRWYFQDDTGVAYRAYDNGRLQRGMVMMDARWKDRSQARAILMPMREAVASHLTVFDGGGAIYSLQYAGSPGAGQFYLGTCEETL